MRFGLGIPTCREGLAYPSGFADLQATAQLAQAAERLGFDTVWLSEHHLTPDGMPPSPLVLAAAGAAIAGIFAGALGWATAYFPIHLSVVILRIVEPHAARPFRDPADPTPPPNDAP